LAKQIEMIERLSTVQYAEKIGMKKQSILYRIAQGLPLVGVSAIEKIAGRNILHTDLKELQRHCKNKLKKVR
jgi:hypothetical protein